MYYTDEELKQLDEIKRSLAVRHIYRSPRETPWTQDEILNIMKHNVCTMPIEAACMASRGKYKVAAAMLRLTVRSLEEIQGLEDGTLEYRDSTFYNVSTGEVVE